MVSRLKTALGSKHVQEEAVFFVMGVLPYWYTLWLPQKTASYWIVLVWCCLCWIIYGWHRRTYVSVLNNVVELGIAVSGIVALSKL